MKNVMLSVLFCSICSPAWPQTGQVTWQFEKQLPAKDIYSIKVINGRLTAGTVNQVFISDSIGSNWTGSPAFEPNPTGVDDIIRFNGKMYATGYNRGLFESADLGKTWASSNKGLPSNAPMKFAERKGVLYVATSDQGIYQLNAAGTQWSAFNDGLYSNISYNFNSLANFSGTLVGSPGANGMITIRNETSAAWETYYLAGRIRPGLHTYDLVQAGGHIWAFTNDRVYASSDRGRSWTQVAEGMRRGYDSRGVQLGNDLYASVTFGNNSLILYKRLLSAPLSEPWMAIDTLDGYFCYGLATFNKRLYMATHLGLYYTSISGQPVKPEFPFKIKDPVVFPNPTRGNLNLRYGLSREESHFRLLDGTGKQVLSEKIVSDDQALNISALSPGIYYYSIDSKTDISKRGKVVVKSD
jgi:photosystem II stability/assembly factor-like uncharacterized protein